MDGLPLGARGCDTAVMELGVTLAVAAALLALGLLAGWRGARPPDPRRGPRLIPWRFLMLLSAALALLMLLVGAMLLAGGHGPAAHLPTR